MKYFYFLLLTGMISLSCQQSDTLVRETVDLTQQDWRLWLDQDADWQDDTLYLPPVSPDTLPVNPPTCGWVQLEAGNGISITLPATVEKHFWGDNGNSYGTAGNYLGVSWFTTRISIPESWQRRRIVLNFESVRLRAEIYLNRELAGYDLVDSTCALSVIPRPGRAI